MEDATIEHIDYYIEPNDALAYLNFASEVDDDLTPSEDETPEAGALRLEIVQSAIGVSIGQQQTHFLSPKTPAAEKAAALDETDSGQLFEGWAQPGDGASEAAFALQAAAVGKFDGQEIVSRNGLDQRGRNDIATLDSPRPRLPSPWRAGPRTFRDEAGEYRNIIRSGLPNGRCRASSNGAMTEAFRKSTSFNLPTSISKTYKDFHFSLPSFSALSLASDRGRPTASATVHRTRETIASAPATSSLPKHCDSSKSTEWKNTSSNASVSLSKTSNMQSVERRDLASNSKVTTSRAWPSSSKSIDRRSGIRRSNSDGSLHVYRTMSFASSLGDDTRFEGVQEQVNSRLKAIKDSWADSSFKLPNPSLSSFPNFHLGLKDDLFKGKSTGTTSKFRPGGHSSSQRVDYRSTTPAPSDSTEFLARKSMPQFGIADNDSHPYFAQALQDLEGDLVVLGGYRGSILRSAEPPNRQLWVPIKVGLNLRKAHLEVPLDPDADERMEETIYSSGMLQHIGPVDISKRLFKRLRSSRNVKSGRLKVHDYGYDWRLSPHFLSRRFIRFLERLPCNQPGVPVEKRGAVVLAHSLGGLITRHAINRRPDLIAGVVYAGVPQRCVNILGPLRNGDDVLFSSRVLTAQVNFTIRTSYVLLPLDGKCFINKHTKEEYPVDFFDLDSWKEYRLSPCIAAPVPRPEAKENMLSVSGLINAVSQAMPTFPTRKNVQSNSDRLSSSTPGAVKDAANVARTVADKISKGGAKGAGIEPSMTKAPQHCSPGGAPNNADPATDITIPREQAAEYLIRVLAEVKAFKEELAHIPAHSESNSYPPIALIYGKSTPTVYGAKVESREAIKRADVYDELAFASGDGVVLARAAMVPDGYSVVRGGMVSSDRGHVTLLGDLEAVGRCLQAIIHARQNGVGLGELGQKRSLMKRKSDGSTIPEAHKKM